MNKLAFILAGFLLFATGAQAQETNEQVAKILPTNSSGVIKILYTNKTNTPVHVKFYNEDDILYRDNIKAKDFDNGFLRKYDIRHIATKDFYIEVKSETMSVLYKMVEAPGNGFTPVLENTTYYYPSVVARN